MVTARISRYFAIDLGGHHRRAQGESRQMSYQRLATQHGGRSKSHIEHCVPKSVPAVPTNQALIQGDWRVERLQFFINSAHGKLGWTLDSICRDLDLGVSGSYGGRLFKRHTGLGVREYTKRRRLALAADRLENTTLSIKEIAADLGYKNQTDLSRQFRQLFRLNPKEYREAHRRAIQQIIGADHFSQYGLVRKENGT